jgi:ABC-type arginine transport system ATPase subunit
VSDAAAIRTLIDRAAISDVVNAYATAVDSRDWALFASLFAPSVFIDFRSFHPDLHREVSREELVEITRGIAAFDATQHLSTNHRHTIAGERATCVSYMHAGHFLKRDGADHACFLYGFYTYELFREGAGWLIDRYGLRVTAQHGDPRVFEWTGML